MVMNRVPADIYFNNHGQGSTPFVPSDQAQSPNELLVSIARSLQTLVGLRTISTGVVSRSVVVHNTPTQLVRADAPRNYSIINPTSAIGLTTSALFFGPTALVGNGNTQATTIGVSNYDTMHLFGTITNAVGLSLTLTTQVLNPFSNVWIDVQEVLTAANSNADIYFNLGNFGIATQFAVKWVIAGTCTLKLGYTLKGGLGGSSQGTSNTIFIGNTGVTLQSGFPLLEGQYRDFAFDENAEMWAIANQDVTINILEYI